MCSCPLSKGRAMASVSASPSAFKPRNQLLAALSPADLILLQPHLTPVVLKLREDLERPNRRIDDVYFIDSGIASVVAMQSRKERVEVGLIGCEGMSGTSVVLGSGSSPNSTYLQVAGDGQHISSAALCVAMEDSKTLHGLLLRYVQAFMVQTAHTAIANARATLDQRLARWVLMADDRIPGGKLPLTHEFLSLMLGVRRAGVTEALHSLSGRRFIATGRGEIVVLNRKGLERKAGDLYGTPETEYRRLI
jgi:CRP-like cAMP-binding protein